MAGAQVALANNSLNSINTNSAANSQAIASSGGGGGGCFITTAICETENLPDNCEELELLRAFRDHYVRRLPDGKAIIDEYYREAPLIVSAIKCKSNSAEIFKFLKEKFLDDAVHAVRAGLHEMAMTIYIRMFHEAKRKAAL